MLHSANGWSRLHKMLTASPLCRRNTLLRCPNLSARLPFSIQPRDAGVRASWHRFRPRALFHLCELPPARLLWLLRAAAPRLARGVRGDAKDTRLWPVFLLYCAPGITRGGHYHHTKTEKFLVIKGKARFRFRHTQTGSCMN